LDVADDRASSCNFGDCVPYEPLDQIHGQPEILKACTAPPRATQFSIEKHRGAR